MDKHQFPANFINTLHNEPGFDAENFIVVHQKNDAPTSIRANPFKYAPLIDGENVPWCAEGRYLETRPSFTFDPLFHA